jgi:hypothetical protein
MAQGCGMGAGRFYRSMLREAIILAACLTAPGTFLYSQATDAVSVHYPRLRDASGKIEFVGPTASHAGLERRFGAGNLAPCNVDLGEGETAAGTALFPNDPERRAEIVWADTAKRSMPARVIITGSKSRWEIGPGVTLGTSLSDLELLNKRPFFLAGFDWDYSGTVLDWRGGNLAVFRTGQTEVILRLAPAADSPIDAKMRRSVSGDRRFSSSHKAMRKLNPRVYQIVVAYP